MMNDQEESHVHAVTGAFGYTGKYIAKKLIAAGQHVLTLTNSTPRGSLAGVVPAFSFNFEQPDELLRTLEDVDVLYNTYWVRFNHPQFTHADAVRNTLTLFKAAKDAGVQRVVHISITNPSEDSTLEYFNGKARLERALRESGLSYVILRPALIFGREDILINNIAWVLRHLPVFGVFGNGKYKLQPIYVEDLAELAVMHATSDEKVVVDAIGPETFTYRGLVEKIAQIIGVRRLIIGVPPVLGYLVGRLIGARMGDVTITRDEIAGLMANLLYVDAPPAGHTRLTEWAHGHANMLGKRYANELSRRLGDQSKGWYY